MMQLISYVCSQVNTESVQCISIAYSKVRITEISEQSRPEWLKWKGLILDYVSTMFKL